ncbi:hypothetical protein V8E36_004373 [Tilletia maclaganii]
MMIAMLNDIAIASTSGPAPVTPARPGHFHCLDTPRTEELPRATVSVQIAELLAEIEPQAAASPQQVEDDGPRIPVRRRPRKVFSPIPMSSNNAVVTPEADRLGPADSPRRTERVRAAAKMDAPLRSILNQIGSGSPRRNVARRSGLGKGKVNKPMASLGAAAPAAAVVPARGSSRPGARTPFHGATRPVLDARAFAKPPRSSSLRKSSVYTFVDDGVNGC